MTPALILVGLLSLGLAGWFLIPILNGLPWRPTQRDRIRRALQMADLRPGEVVCDLGSGDGRVLMTAAADFGAHAVGIEWSPLQYLWSLAVVGRPHSGPPIRVRWGDCFRTDVTGADVVVAYMTAAQGPRLLRLLEEQLRPGARVLTISFELPGREPAAFDPEGLLYLYRWPPRLGGLGSYLARRPASGGGPGRKDGVVSSHPDSTPISHGRSHPAQQDSL